MPVAEEPVVVHQIHPDPHAVKIQIEDIPETDEVLTSSLMTIRQAIETNGLPTCYPGQVVPEVAAGIATPISDAAPSAPPFEAPPPSQPQPQPVPQSAQTRMSIVTVSPRPQSPVEAQEVTQPFIPGNSSVRDVEAYKKCVDVLTVIIKEILPKNSVIQSNPKIDAEINQMAIDSLITLRFYSLQDDRLREQSAARKE